jgi:hypothetical protein
MCLYDETTHRVDFVTHVVICLTKHHHHHQIYYFLMYILCVAEFIALLYLTRAITLGMYCTSAMPKRKLFKGLFFFFFELRPWKVDVWALEVKVEFYTLWQGEEGIGNSKRNANFMNHRSRAQIMSNSHNAYTVYNWEYLYIYK